MAAQRAKHQEELEAERKEKAQKAGETGETGADGEKSGEPAEESEGYDAPMTAEEIFYEMDPLRADMWHYEPRNHRSTLIWLPDHFETHGIHSHSFNLLQSKQLRVAIPSPPKRECSVVGGEEKNAWYDVAAVPFNAEKSDGDFEGLKVSMYQLHQLIRDEAYYLGEKIALEMHSGDLEKVKAMADHEVEKIGAERVFVGGFGQGGALALFSGLRYPRKLGGIFSHSGYIPYVSQTAEVVTNLEADFKKKKQEEEGQQQQGDETVSSDSTAAPVSPPPSPSQFNVEDHVPNIRTPLYVVYNQNDQVIPWLGLAQPSYISAIKPPLQCKMILRTGKSTGHSIASGDLFEFQFWQNELITQLDTEMRTKLKLGPMQDM